MERTSLLLIVLMLLVIVLIIALVVVTTEKDYQRTRMHQEIQSLQTPKRLVGKHMNIL